MNYDDQNRVELSHRTYLEAEIASLRAQLHAEEKKTYAAQREVANKQLRIELLCSAVISLADLAEESDRLRPDNLQALIDNARMLATELLT
jgi:hypothetical protein